MYPGVAAGSSISQFYILSSLPHLSSHILVPPTLVGIEDGKTEPQGERSGGQGY